MKCRLARTAKKRNLAGMRTLFFVLILLAALGTLAMLIRGVLLMASGKDISGERQNKLMIKRIGWQAATVLLVMVFLMFMSTGR